MATLRIRLRFNPGRLGSPMDKLGEFSTQMERFLRSLSDDLGIGSQKGKWLARNFTNDSVAFDGEYSDSVDDEAARNADAALRALSSDAPLEAYNIGLVGHRTLAEFAKIGRSLDADEVFYVGLYSNDNQQPEWHPVSHKQTTEIRKTLEAPVTTIGSVQGIVHSWHTGSKPRFFQVRELVSGNLVRCEYEDALHDLVHRATEMPSTVVHVYGRTEWDSVSDSIVRILVEDVETAEPIPDSEFHHLFGAAPQYTGELSTSDYIAWLRGDDE